MRTSPFAAAAVACLFCAEAFALQLGQLSTASRLGEPLDARVELYGALPADTSAIGFELRPDIGAPHGGAARATVASMRAELVSDARGFAHVSLRSSIPVSEPALSFRLRMRTGSTTVVRHYALALAPPPLPVAQREGRRTVPAPAIAQVMNRAPAEAGGDYGPVQPGQSLWRILQQAGLAAGNTQATIARIVADNPHAFIGGDANRLRVGVMLTLAGARGAAASSEGSRPAPATPAAPAKAPASSEVVILDPPASDLPAPSTAGETAVAETDATPDRFVPGVRAARAAERIAALEEKFAAIRARYAAQEREQAQSAEPQSFTQTAPRPAPAAATDEPVAPSPETQPQAVPAGSETAAGEWYSIAGIVLAIVATVLALYLLVRGASSARHALSERRSHRETSRADDALRAEIARKAEKRVELEGQVRQRLGQQGEKSATRASGDTIERAVTSAAGTDADAEVDEAESRIAHGFYSDAEGLLKSVIARTPGNHRAKLRLAEIYYLNERHDEFVELAAEIHRLHRTEVGDENWQRIMRMGKIVAPERPPFSGPKAIESAS